VVEIENPEHSDFIKLRNMLIMHMQDLQEITQEVHYENYRLQKLATENRSGSTNGNSGRGSVDSSDGGAPNEDIKSILEQKDAELRRMQEMMAKLQAQASMRN